MILKTIPIVLAVLAQTGAAPALIGRWDVVTRSRGGIGAWLTFSAGGSCSQTTGAMLDGTWRVDGDRLTRSVVATPEGKVETETFTMAIQGSTLRLGSESGRPSMSRVGQASSGAASLAGLWKWAHPAGGTAFEEYLPDGRYLFRLPIRTDPCQWIVNGQELRLTTREQARTFPWRVEGDRLTLERDGKPDAFRRERTDLSAIQP